MVFFRIEVTGTDRIIPGPPNNPPPIKIANNNLRGNFKNHLQKVSNRIIKLQSIFEANIDPKDPTNNCLDVAIITAPEKRTKKTINKLKNIAGRVLIK